ncbi:adenylate cyclase Cya3 [Rhodoplanes sp. Z2-YC6860]|nr:adenylate cyclase Cya3 [Rhodoplanes sp. Z2-YC6860]
MLTMAEARVERRLSAILAADIAGFSALVGADEAHTACDLEGHQAVIVPMVVESGGRVIDAGDGILAEFPNAVNAVKCAVAIQSMMAERNVGIEPERCMEFRIGVNIGELVDDKVRVHGDGIDVAAKLEAIAEPGGICVSSKVYEEVSGQIDLAYQDIGERQLENIAQPVRVYRVQLGKSRTGAERQLTAMLAADVAGYSRLVENDEEGTLAQWKGHWHGLIEPKIKEFHGRIVRVIGDGVLVEFASVVDAVRCAVEVQRGMAARNAEVPHDKRIEFRMGINFGELIIDGGDFWGDAVNITARLEALAEPGGICVSGRVQEDVKGKLDIVFEDAGEQQLKNIARPVRVYRIRTSSGGPIPAVIQQKPRAARSRLRWSLAAAALLVLLLGGGEQLWQSVSQRYSLSQVIREAQAPAPLPDKRSIAVLPFLNMSSDPEQEYFSDGMTEDLITELSRLTGLFVIARNSVYTFKGRAIRIEQVSRELGVRYVVEGSVRKADNRLRITAQLIDGNTGYHVWAQYYDRELHDVFGVQEEIARRITSALAVKLTKEEEKNMGRPYTSNPVAWEYFMRGAELYRRFTPKDNAEARSLFEKAISLDPEFSRAYAILAATHRQDSNGRWSKDPQTSEELAYRMAQKAVELARKELEPKPSLPYALEQIGWVLLYREKHEEARQAAEEAVQRNHNYADGYALWAHVLIYMEKPEEALRKSQEAIAHNPIYPFFYDYHRGQAYYVWGVLTSAKDPDAARQRFEEAEKHLRAALAKNNNFRPARSYLVATLSELGRKDEAAKEMKISLEKGEPLVAILKSGDQKLSDEHIRTLTPYTGDEIRSRLAKVWREAAR